ncbi:hypothetical protein PROFUN_15347 [Planoprotostelium fungivorum]|uniref:Uncharacterized protein n=1 Tax=Planoprotostelium fungivorum TaxID=1890364 RepID=A0A2P6MWM7_9EUKA|nr:hypothetical protein PROFUN_15347 [Planoprotostelium fungivorum]
MLTNVLQRITKQNTGGEHSVQEHALYRLGGNYCTLKDSSLCLTEAEANEGLWCIPLFLPLYQSNNIYKLVVGVWWIVDIL